MKIPRVGFALLICATIITDSAAQLNPGALETFLNDGTRVKKSGLRYPSQVHQFYTLRKFQTFWNEDTALQRPLLSMLKRSADYGLREKDYQRTFFGTAFEHQKLIGFEDSIIAELQKTDLLMHFLHDVVYGNTPVQPGFNGLNYFPACFDIAGAAALAAAENQLALLPESIEQNNTEYTAIKKSIKTYNNRILTTGFEEVLVTSPDVTIGNKSLLTKLFQLGIMDSISWELTDPEIRNKLKKAQQLFNIKADGIMNGLTIAALNIPVSQRLNELMNAINTLRWLSCAKQSGKIILVNIPSAKLKVYEYCEVILESKIIVGKPSTPTPTLCSKINEVSLYPYWRVPNSIAVRELLPFIKRNVGYLDDNGYQVIDKNGQIIDPYKINWQSLNRSYFPYIIRQSSGCDNALGLVKFNFYNPYSVYLHDTPNKNLFNSSRRYFSHGCMRVEKAMELAHFILKDNRIAIDTLEARGCLQNQSPVTLKAGELIPVFVLYNTASIDSAGQLSFSEDIYRKNQFFREKADQELKKPRK